ncbi:hypothetical protein NQ314_015297 [Rhamnusium bicolor]|uniref:Uncharacterized protein n=1 Tax=Rhamnusium bicolor TaxID=1586634 RepID=A0AAV8WYR2_9CUCU|nr:hypothetical protein NQ314_015297 [Rhamnusium bicolor]
MLEVLTETSDTKEARERIAGILDEQRKTLRFAMSRPQVVMVNKAMKEINKIAKFKHATLQGKLGTSTNQEGQSDSNEINNNEKLQAIDEEKVSLSNRPLSDSQLSLESIESENKVLEKNKGKKLYSQKNNAFSINVFSSFMVPETDIFDIPNLPALCPSEACKSFEKEGCYLALLKRKKIVRLDDKYMIQMAENRGLFGSTTTAGTLKSKSSRASKKKQDKTSDKSHKPKKLRESEIDRIAAPTHTFLRHTKLIHEVAICRKSELEEDKPTKYRLWWTQATHHILSLKHSLVRQKIIPSHRIRHVNPKSIVDSLMYNIYNIDELVATYNLNSRIPVFPRLRLTRATVYGKVQIPVHITSVEFPVKTVFVASIQVTTKYLRASKECEPIETREAGIVARENVPRNILGKLSSAHIRQFVCPFYKQKEKPDIPLYKQRVQSLSSFYAEQRNKDISVNVPSKINNETTDEPSEMNLDTCNRPTPTPAEITQQYLLEQKIITIPPQRRSLSLSSNDKMMREEDEKN